MRMRSFLPAVLSTLLPTALCAEEPVYFADPALKAAVEQALWVPNPTPDDMLGLTALTSNSTGIAAITGLEYAANLQELTLRQNNIGDLSPLAGLVSLTTLVLNNNRIADLSPLAGLHNLEHLDLHENGLTDISPLSGLDNLRYLNAHGNQLGDIAAVGELTRLQTLIIGQNRISDISALSALTDLRELNLSANQIADLSPLANLTSLTSLDLRANPLNQDAYDLYVPQILANNPGIDLQCLLGLSLSSGEGGAVVEPGEGLFSYKYGDTVSLRAQANPGFVFTHWSGTLYSTQNPYSLNMNTDHQITANFDSTSGTLYVNDDAQDDPGPDDPDESDPLEDGAVEHPFDSVQEAVDAAASGDCIRIYPGTYRETIDLAGKSIELQGIDSENPDRPGWPVIDGRGNGPVVSVSPVDKAPNCTLAGLVLTGGKAPLAAAIFCSHGNLTLVNCLIAGNRANDPFSAAIYCEDSNVVLVNCTIADNHAGTQGAALASVDSPVTMVNSILWGNTPAPIVEAGTSKVSTSYSDMADDPTDPGVIQDQEPVHFADAALKAAVEQALWVPNPTPGDMLGLTALTSNSTGIAAITGLEYAANLQELTLRQNNIGDLSPLAGLVSLTTLVLNNNRIADLSPLAGLHNLEHLDLHENGLADLSPLSGLTNLRHLNAHANRIADISPLGSLTGLQTLIVGQNRIRDISPLSALADLRELNLSTNQIEDIASLAELASLTSLDLRANPLNQDAYDLYVPQILANNPGIDLQCLLGLSLSSGEGGAVIEPGEGLFSYKYGDTVSLRAQADPGFVFTHWSGTLYSTQNPYSLNMNTEHQITANFDSASGVFRTDGPIENSEGSIPHGRIPVGCGFLAIAWMDVGCIRADPRFARAGSWADRNDPAIPRNPDDPDAIWIMGDYHLQSEAGRWDPEKGGWAQDAVTSPCIDAGDPNSPIGREPVPNGGIINMGVYGGTPEASKSPTRH